MRAAIHILAVILGLASLPLSSYSQRTLGDYIRFCSALSGRTPTPDSIRNWDRQGSAAGRYDGRLELVSVRYTSDTGEIATELYGYANGHLREIRLSDSTCVYRREAEDDWGSVTAYTTGRIRHRVSYDTGGRVTSLASDFGPAGVSWGYVYDGTTGNIVSFTDSVLSRTEDYAYDGMDRLTRFGADSVAYGLTGNIVRSSLAGKYTYDANRPYAVTGVTDPRGRLTERDQDVTYTSQDRPLRISQGGYTASFRYDMHGNRTRLVLTGDSTHWGYTKYYMDGIYEVTVADTMVREVLWLGGDAYSAGTAYVRESGGTWTLWSVQRDRQGCITGVCNAGGEVLWRGSYDAWGNMRNPDTWTLYNADSIPEPLLGRGYTGHEHLTPFGLVNMNARLYDPMLGRFLSPDNLVQAPSLGQNYNRYSYCLNNPLRYTDQSGEIFGIDDILVGMAIGAIINVAYQGFKGNIHNPMDVFKAATIGAAGAAVASMTVAWSGIAAVGVIGGAKVGAIAGLSGSITTGIGNAMGFSDDMSLQDVFFSTTIGAVTGGIYGGLEAKSKGVEFWTGETFSVDKNSHLIQNTLIEEEGRIQINAKKPQELYHYTSRKGYDGIMESHELLPSSGLKNARYGNGQYFTDIIPTDYTKYQISRRLYRVPWNTQKTQYYLN